MERCVKMIKSSYLCPCVPDHVCRLLSNHHNAGNGITVWHNWEYRRVRDSNVRHSTHSKLWIHHSCRIVVCTHSAGAGLVIFWSSCSSYVAFPVCVAAEVIAGQNEFYISVNCVSERISLDSACGYSAFFS